jgi:hypothetical protein
MAWFMGRASGAEAYELADLIVAQAAKGMATRAFSTPGDMNSVATLALTYQVREANYPGDWQLLATDRFGVCLVSSNWTDD